MPRRGQVRIQVTAAALNPVDAATQEGLMSQARPGILSPREHIGLGWDVAGVVDQVADGVAAFAPGDAVIGLRDRLDTGVGTFAEQVVLDTGDLAAAPSGVDPVAASTIPLNGLTALQALDALASSGLHAGRSILVTGAAGGLGGFGVELAAMRGLRVIGAAGAADEELVRKLGASHFIPRSAASLAADVRDLVPGGVDAVFDAAALGFPAMDTVRGGGIYVNFVPVDPIPVRGIRVLPVHIRADGAALAGLSSLAGAGRLTLRVAGTYPLEQAAEAFARLAKGGLRGRLVLVP
jgi:NADPH:quinone reductase-like Zn-dependent oxidoreductase